MGKDLIEFFVEISFLVSALMPPLNLNILSNNFN
jgi:hypothetical protein